jgi:hypothetical protein
MQLGFVAQLIDNKLDTAERHADIGAAALPRGDPDHVVVE